MYCTRMECSGCSLSLLNVLQPLSQGFRRRFPQTQWMGQHELRGKHRRQLLALSMMGQAAALPLEEEWFEK